MPRRPSVRDARDYDTTQLRKNGHGAHLHRDYSAHFFRWSFVRRWMNKTQSVLEVGCGQDLPLAKVLVRGINFYCSHYTGVDLNSLPNWSNQRCTLHSNFNFVERYIELLTNQPDGWDNLVNLEVIEHMRVDHGKHLLAAMFACTKPGGRLFISTPVYSGNRQAANHIHEYTIEELREALEEAGYIVEKRFGTFMDLRHIKANQPKGVSHEAVLEVCEALSVYFDNDAISNFFGPLYPDHAKNNLWVCRRPAQATENSTSPTRKRPFPRKKIKLEK